MTDAINREIVGVRIKLSSPERIRELSKGEVKKPETINYRTLRPEKEGLFCERIFGPTKSYECACGKYKRSGPKFRGVVCDRCGVEVTDNRVRRERMGHIELAAPVVHIWYLRGIPSRLSLLIGASTKDLEKVVYFAPSRRRERSYKVVSAGIFASLKGSLVSQSEERVHRHYDPQFKAEPAYRISKVDEFPLSEGDLLTKDKYDKYKKDFGEEFTAEPAFYLFKKGNEGGREAVTEETAKARKKEDKKLVSEPAMLGSQEAYIVTSATHLPFAKGDVLSESESKHLNEEYPKRFTTQEETMTIEDPCYLVIDPGKSAFQRASVVIEREERACRSYDKLFEAGIGAEGVLTLLKRIDVSVLSAQLREEIAESTGQKKRKLVKRLQVADDFLKSDSKPDWMILSVLPVIPPDLRPMVQLDGGRFATSDLNDLYRRVINRNNRLRRLQELHAPEIIVRNEKRMLQESVDALIDNGRRGKAVLGAGNRPLKSLTDLLRGKKGRFRQNLLGKRVDYSGRSVIVIGPYLKIYQCGVPKEMALELFKPFVMHKLVELQLAPNVKSARRFIDKGREEVWALLEDIIKDHPVMLNRAPTLHRLGIQAFEPVLVEGKALRLHPLVCTAFNADFDGDQMAIHVPLSLEAQTEARVLMLSSNNLLSPASGKPVVVPTQDMILGMFYITTILDGQKGEGMYFNELDDVLAALDHNLVNVHSKIFLKKLPEWHTDAVNEKGEPDPEGKWILTCPGRALFNTTLHRDIRFVNKRMNKKSMAKLLDDAYDQVGQAAMVRMLDQIKSLGYHWSTMSGISLGVGDIIIPSVKKEIVDDTMEKDNVLTDNYNMGILTEDEYLREKDILWSEAGGRISDQIMDGLDDTNSLRIMVDSGARGSRGQVAQMAGIRGLMADPSGRIIGYPITANFVEGLNTLQYFISTHGARKGLADTALRTAKSGYLTRRLVDVAQDLIITEEDCGTHEGIEIRPLRQQDGKIMIPMSERLAGRVSLEELRNPETGELLLERNEEITNEKAAYIDSLGIESVWVRSPLTCGCKNGICRTCYGRDLSTRDKVSIGESVGVVAAQSIGEPGTQLTLRTFHTGGVHTSEDITQGLPRIEQLFEVRRPKKVAILAEVDGVLSEIKVSEGKRKLIISVENEAGEEEKLAFNIPLSQNLSSGIVEGCEIVKGMQLTEGYVDPQQLLEVEGLEAVQHYLLDGIQDVYRSQGVTINDKHIETILRKVAPINRVRVVEEGDSSFVSGELVWKDILVEAVKKIAANNEISLDQSVEFLEKFEIKQIPAEYQEQAKGRKTPKLTRALLAEMLKPGGNAGEVLAADENGEVKIILGDAAFRRMIEGREIIQDFEDPKTGEILIKKGQKLTDKDLTTIVSCTPQPIQVRNIEFLNNAINSRWLAEDVKQGGKVVLKADSCIDETAVKVICNYGIEGIKLWKNNDRIEVKDVMHDYLIDLIGNPLTQAFDEDGEVVENRAQTIDGAIVHGLVDGKISGIETEGRIITREKVIKEALSSKLRSKVLLETVEGTEGTILAGTEITPDVLEKIAEIAPETLVVRSRQAMSEYRQIIARVAFVRRLREAPKWKPVVHGVTKAALATDSFLSAASFQQTAQVLASSAVRGDVDDLVGLKENVIIGLLIPSGTGIERYNKVEVTDVYSQTEETEEAPAEEIPAETAAEDSGAEE